MNVITRVYINNLLLLFVPEGYLKVRLNRFFPDAIFMLNQGKIPRKQDLLHREWPASIVHYKVHV